MSEAHVIGADNALRHLPAGKTHIHCLFFNEAVGLILRHVVMLNEQPLGVVDGVNIRHFLL